MQNNTESNHELIIKNRKYLEVDGIKFVSSLNEENVVLETDNVTIGIEGTSLKIENLEKNTGKIIIVGEINGVYYLEKSAKKRGRKLLK